MVLFSKHYTEAGVAVQLQAVINDALKDITGPPVILCIGSDRHVLDCFGPLTGSMLNQAGISVPVYGDLDHPCTPPIFPVNSASYRKPIMTASRSLLTLRWGLRWRLVP